LFSNLSCDTEKREKLVKQLAKLEAAEMFAGLNKMEGNALGVEGE
jgi:hypothetical protein